MDVYGISAPESFGIDDLLDFSNSELFSSSTAAAAADQNSELYPHFPSSFTNNAQSSDMSLPNKTHLTDFTDDLYVPNDEVAELEWLSNFVDDSFTDFSTNELANVVNVQPAATFHSRSRSKRSRATSTSNVNGWIISTESDIMEKTSAGGKKRDNSAERQDMARRCTHCASEKTPQWRTGPLGPKTLCNACGVRYKSGRLVPEYRPAASPTFVLTQHSNSHRKVMELRRQKEIVKQEQHEHEQQLFQHHHHHHHLHQYHHQQQQQQQQQQKNFEVC